METPSNVFKLFKKAVRVGVVTGTILSAPDSARSQSLHIENEPASDHSLVLSANNSNAEVQLQGIETEQSIGEALLLPTALTTPQEHAQLQPLIEARYSTFTLIPGNLEVFEFQVAQDESGRFVFPDQGLTLEPGSPLDQMVQYQAQRVQERFGNNFRIHLISRTPSAGILQGETFENTVAAELMEEQQLDDRTIPAGTVVRFDEATGNFSYFAPNDSTQIGYGLMTLQDLLNLQDALAEQGIEMSLPQSIDPLEEYILPVGLRFEDDTIRFLYTERVAIEFERPILRYDGSNSINLRALPNSTNPGLIVGQLQPGSTYERVSTADFLQYLQSGNARGTLDILPAQFNITPIEGQTLEEAITSFFENKEFNNDNYDWTPIRVDSNIFWVADLPGISLEGGLNNEFVPPTETPEPAERIDQASNSVEAYINEPIILIDNMGGTVSMIAEQTGLNRDQILTPEPAVNIPQTFNYNGISYQMGYLGTTRFLSTPEDGNRMKQYAVAAGVVERVGNFILPNGETIYYMFVLIPSSTDPVRPTRMYLRGGANEQYMYSQRIELENDLFSILNQSDDQPVNLSEFASIETQSLANYAQSISIQQPGNVVILFLETNRSLSNFWEDVRSGTLTEIDNTVSRREQDQNVADVPISNYSPFLNP